LRAYLEAQLRRLEIKAKSSRIDFSKELIQMLRPSPQLQNINELYQDETSTSRSSTPKKLNFNVSNDIINEEPEEEEMQGKNLKCFAKELYELRYKELPIDKYAALLGTNEQWNYLLCKEFMKLFDSWPDSLIQALRVLCSKLYLVGESTQIDQILDVFAQSWYQSHPQNDFGDHKSLHIVCFSLLILNSDLHNNQNQESKFTRDQFVENTLYAINEENLQLPHTKTLIEALKSSYASIYDQKLELMRVLQNQKVRRQKPKRALTPPKSPQRQLSNVSLISNKNTTRLSSIGSSVSISTSIRRMSSFPEVSEINYTVNYKKDDYDEELESLGPPWAVEGLIKCEIQLPPKKKKSWMSWLGKSSEDITSELDVYNIKDWKQSIVVVSEGLLRQYSFGSASDRKNFMRTKSDDFVSTVITYNLYSATASLVEDNIISNSEVQTNGVPWVLTIPNLLTNDYTQDKKVVYYAPNLDVATSFVDTCNFWAARITSIPSSERNIVTNQEYGWSSEVLNGEVHLKTVSLQKWKCLLSVESSFVPSSLDLKSQFGVMSAYVEDVDTEVKEHNALKPKIEQIWGENGEYNERYQIVMTNWSEKYVYLFKQKSKYKTYLDSLEKTLTLKASMI
jgi:hypothetical protein